MEKLKKMEKHEDRLLEKNHKATAADGSSEASNSQRDLVSGLCDDVVLGEIIPRLSRAMPRDKRPVLSLLSRSWANAMAGHSPLLYDRAYNPFATLSSGELIVYRCGPSRHPGRFNNRDTSLWLWNRFSGIKNTLPPPPVRNITRRWDAAFVCDGEKAYVLTPDVVTEKPNVHLDVYDVWMLNLREFNIRWKKLPSLPRLGNDIYASSCVGESYIWQRRQIHSLAADGWKLSRSEENDSDWQWQYVNVNTPPPPKLIFDKSDRLPFYIEINRVDGDQVVAKILYARCLLPYLIPDYKDRDSYIFMFLDLESDDSRPIIYGDLYSFEVDQNQNCALCLLKAELDTVKTRTVEEGEWADFLGDWNTARISTAIKVFWSISPWKEQHKLRLDNCRYKPLNKFSPFMVLQNGPIYGFRSMTDKPANWW